MVVESPFSDGSSLKGRLKSSGGFEQWRFEQPIWKLFGAYV